jgi:hypothetical protein
MAEIIFDENEDWEKRILCSDESCIGTIGSDGLCQECGKPYDGKISNGQIKNSDQVIAKEKNPVNAEMEDDWNNRVLCSDESCIGVIGSDGKCKECGKRL